MSSIRTTLLAAALAALICGSAAAQTEQEAAVYIHAGTLLDRPGQEPRGRSTIVVRNGLVESVRDGFIAPEPGARLVDLSQQFVLPGLIDMHVHMLNDDDKMRSRLEANNRDVEDTLLIAVDNARRTLEAGFTTVRDLGSDVRSITALRDAINAGRIPGPTIVAAGRAIAITAGHGDPSNNTNRDITKAVRERSENLCNGADDCRRAVRSQISQGADVIKFAATGGVNSNIAGGLNQQMFPDEMKAIVDTAHMFGRKVAAHAHGQNGIKAALEAGVDSIEHATYTDSETNALFKRKGAWLVPTMIAPHAALAQARAGARSKASLAKAEQAAAAHAKNIAAAIRDGVKIAFGTDTGVSDHGKNAQEFALLVKAGMTPAAAIRAATIDAATLLDRADQLGSIEPGKQADIIAVASSPLEDVTQLERVQFVMRRGVVHVLDGARQPFP
ncbi:MAG TPA: amidohydrolase family protein [Steroidobacter sp.]